MTTVAADAVSGVMVSDSKCTYGDTWHPITKIFRIGDALYGCAGDVKEWLQFVRWQRGGRKGPRPKGESHTVVVLDKDGVHELSANGCYLTLERGFHAIGTGAHAAIAAMMCGKGPAQAVDLAMQIDPQSGGAIQTFHLEIA